MAVALSSDMYRHGSSTPASSPSRPTAAPDTVGKRTLTEQLPPAPARPASGTSSPVAGAPAAGASGGASTYTVKNGDTYPIVAALLTGDAGRAGELQAANPGLASLAPGVTLQVPASWVGGIVAGGGSMGIVDAALSWLRDVVAMVPAAPSLASTSTATPATAKAAAAPSTGTTPAAPPAPAAPASAAPAHGDPLALAVSKVGQVSYKNDQFFKGSGTLTDADNKALTSGSPDIKVADCSSFMTWTLAAAGYLGDPKTRAQIIAAININKPLEHGSLAADIAADSDSIKGPAAGFKDAGIGDEVPQAAAKPGDYVQSWGSASGHGHAFMVHRAHATGAAIVGGKGPALETGATPAAATAMGFEGDKIRFVIDETTDPATVGAHEVDAIEELGCHLPGTNSRGDKASGGVFTKGPVQWSAFAKAYVGRLTDSRWTHAPIATRPAPGATTSVPGAASTAAPAGATTPSVDTAAPGTLTSIGNTLAGVASAVTGGLGAVAGNMRDLLGLGDPVTAPAVSPAATAAPAPAPFSAPGVKSCDYLIYPDGKIVYVVGGAPRREFPRGHALHDALHAEIIAVYPALPY